MRSLGKNLNPATVMAVCAIVMSLGGTSYAAMKIKSANVKNGSLTNLDFKEKSLTLADLADQTRNSLRGARGELGNRGPGGDRGEQGLKGPVGNIGAAAPLTSSWAHHLTGLTTNYANTVSPNPQSADWSDFPTNNTRDNLRDAGTDDFRHVALGEGWQMVVALSDVADGPALQQVSSQGLVTTSWNGHLNATATLSIVHRNDGEVVTNNTGGTTRHVRVQCKLVYGSGGNYATYADMGIPFYVSSRERHEVVNLTLTGSVGTTAAPVPPGTYDVAAMCRDVDYTGNTQWSFDSGNILVLGSQP